MQRIRDWMEQNPDGANELRRQNRSYVFFREVQLSDKDEAVGAQGVPLTPGRSIAVDKSLHVYGTPFFIEGELPIESEQSKTPFRRLMIAQDTGSAIVGPARADLYFGAGADAGKVSGRLRHNMRFVMLVPKSLDPVGARPQDAAAGSAAVGENRKTVSAGRSAEGAGDRARQERSAAATAQPATPRRRIRRTPATAAPAGAAAGGAAATRAGPKRAPLRVATSPSSVSPRPMKRRHRPDSRIAGAAAAQARLSEEEHALWESVAKQIKPLRKKPRVAKAQAVSPDAETAAAKPVASPKPLSPAKQYARRNRSCRQPPPLAPLGRRERSQLSRGRKEIDARLDLHGMTQTRAHRALFGFPAARPQRWPDLRARHHRQGQDRDAESERGVLRRQVPQWLSLPEFRSLVVGFEEAHIGHGGEGALYVRIRRSRI